MSRPFAAWPPHCEWANLGILTLVFAAWFGACYGAGAWLAPFIPWRVSVELPLDSLLPLWPGAAGLYLTILPMLLLAPFVLRELASLLPLFAALMLETTIAVVFFLLLPIDDAPVACCEPGWSGALFRVADLVNLHHNNLPSLHVAFACTVALAYAPRASRAGAWALFAWAALVTLSTLFTHQHFVADVAAGVLLAAVCWRVAGAWARRPGVVSAFDVELLCVRNFARFAGRHRRYLFIALAILAAGIPRWRRQRLARAGFAFLQAMDDLLDGDRPSEREPLEVADEMLASLESGEFASHELARLGAAFRHELLARGGPEALASAIALLRAMRNDRCRVLERRVCSREQLRDIHHATFAHSLDAMLLAADSPIRHHEVPLLLEVLGWCSTVRDLREDLAQGLVNIPREVFDSASAERPGVPLPLLVETRAVQRWLAEEKLRARELLDRTDTQLAGLSGKRGAALLRRFAGSMRRYAR
jgi:membrane-associated phospholipid phosphatase